MKIGTDNLIKNNTTGGAGDNGRKGFGVAATLLALVLGLCTLTPTVRAAEIRVEESEQAATRTGLSSKGNLAYCEEEKGAQIYAADFLLLKDKLDTIPLTVFEPALYTHTHRWEYLNINGETHTRHCESCGAAFDLVDAHRAERRENCMFSYGGAEYPGIRFTCTCGYQWEHEEAHTLLFESVDEACHRNSCVLNGTAFCPGYEPVTEEHYAYHYIPCGDGRHHERVCMDCGYRAEEECCFSLPDPDSGGEGDNESDSEGNGIRRCWCGNTEKSDTDTDTETEEDTSNTEAGEPNVSVHTEENYSDTEAGGENEISEAVEAPSEADIEEENPNPAPEAETPIIEEEEMPDTETGA